MSFRAWGPKSNSVYALSVAAAQVNATLPVNFNIGGGQCKIYNSGATDVLVTFYKNANGAPTQVFPLTGAPPVGYTAGRDTVTTVVPKGVEKQVSITIDADSFAAIGSGAGPSIIYVQRGDGSV